jgi:hypothetical protein
MSTSLGRPEAILLTAMPIHLPISMVKITWLGMKNKKQK